MLLIDYFEATALRFPQHPFLHFVSGNGAEDRVISYGEANLLASTRYRAMKAQNLARGDCIAILQPNSVEWVLWYLAAQKLGAVTCALNTDHSFEAIAGLLRRSKARMIVADESNVALSLKLVAQCPLINAVFSPISHPGTMSLGPGNASSSAPIARDPEVSPDDVTVIIFSSGTTSSQPKAIQIPNKSLLNGNGAYLSAVPIDATDRVLLVTPIFHSCTLAWGITAAIMRSATIVLAERFSSSRFWEQVHRTQSTVLWTMGTIIHILLELPYGDVERGAVPSIRTIFAAGMGKRVKDAQRRWGHSRFVDGYGLTESVGTIAVDDHFDIGGQFVCVGKPAPGIDLKIVDPGSAKQCAPGQPGEILLRYGQGFCGYLDDEAAMREAVRDGWFHTGDLAYADEEGRIFFVDRMKDIIRYGGKNISAGEIERVFASHPDIAEAIAVAMPHPVMGEQVSLFLVARQLDRKFSLAEIEAYGASELAPFKLPKAIFNVQAEELPRTPTGKISKFELKRRFT